MSILRTFSRSLYVTRQLLSRRWIHSGLVPDKERDRIQYDVCIVGGGPAGLSAAIRTKQLAKEKEMDISVCVVEKGSEIGSHVISGCVLDPRSLSELIPDWKQLPDLPASMTEGKKDQMRFLTKNRAFWLPLLPQQRNKGCYILSLSEFCRWLGKHAEDHGVDIFPGFAADDVILKPNGSVGGISLNHKGIDKNGERKSNFEPGAIIESRVTLLAEGCRGSISQRVMKLFSLREEPCEHQTYGLGIKEVWEVSEKVHSEGSILHTIGYPLAGSAYGGGFLYHMTQNRVSVGIVVGLDYENPHLSPYHEFQKFKSHPLIQNILKEGKCLEYGARALNEGGLQSLPKLQFPGGALIGCSAGFMNSLRLKGTHGAMKSGILAAEALIKELSSAKDEEVVMMDEYSNRFQNSWLHDELHSVRNVRPAFKYGLPIGAISAALHSLVFRGNEPWTFKNRFEDHETMKPAKEEAAVGHYSKLDNAVTFDVTAALFSSGTNHDHDQPSHLRLLNANLPSEINLPIFHGPESRYCPAGVYEYTCNTDGTSKLQINAQNCLHCKACDIKDPMKNIQWTVPEGGDGPNYTIL